MRNGGRILIVVALVCAPVAGQVAWGFAPLWATPIAMWWHKPGFEAAVADALQRLPGKAGVRVYDDPINIFVTSPSQLAVDTMIATAVRDQNPVLSMNGSQRECGVQTRCASLSNQGSASSTARARQKRPAQGGSLFVWHSLGD